MRSTLFVFSIVVFQSCFAVAKDRDERRRRDQIRREVDASEFEDEEKNRSEPSAEVVSGLGGADTDRSSSPGEVATAVTLPNLASSFASDDQRRLGVLLGKALFWDQQLGSGNGGNYACASCHYSAGADSQPDRINAGTLPAGHNGSPNVIRGSLGVRYAEFVAVRLERIGSEEVSAGVEVFTEPGQYAITDRNAPPAVDSDSIHNFWDGRANYVFNGVDMSGVSIPMSTRGGGLSTLQIAEASQASQAVGPCLSPAEMSSDGRTFADVGYKLCHAVPLRHQTGDIVNELRQLGFGGIGGYDDLIQAAFMGGPLDQFVGDESTGVTTMVQTPDGVIEDRLVSLTEQNFSVFFGVAVGLYEQTLVSIPERLPSKKQIEAFEEMRCHKCHYVDGRSHAVIGEVGNRPFSATGVSPLSVDAGVQTDDQNLDSPVPNFDADEDEGQFKSTHLFNLPLTAPYFHDGSAETLKDMLDFYVRGGDFNERNRNSHVRELDASDAEYRRVLKLMRQLTDPRIEAGLPPFSHPSLTIPLSSEREVYLAPSDVGKGGLHYTVRNATN
ncbi:hypothetical protein OAL43_01630 [bacterium]|nr:hypothetical protein [bacterium]